MEEYPNETVFDLSNIGWDDEYISDMDDGFFEDDRSILYVSEDEERNGRLFNDEDPFAPGQINNPVNNQDDPFA
jgi:hypothetical protein